MFFVTHFYLCLTNCKNPEVNPRPQWWCHSLPHSSVMAPYSSASSMMESNLLAFSRLSGNFLGISKVDQAWKKSRNLFGHLSALSSDVWWIWELALGIKVGDRDLGSDVGHVFHIDKHVGVSATTLMLWHLWHNFLAFFSLCFIFTLGSEIMTPADIEVLTTVTISLENWEKFIRN